MTKCWLYVLSIWRFYSSLGPQWTFCMAFKRFSKELFNFVGQAEVQYKLSIADVRTAVHLIYRSLVSVPVPLLDVFLLRFHPRDWLQLYCLHWQSNTCTQNGRLGVIFYCYETVKLNTKSFRRQVCDFVKIKAMCTTPSRASLTTVAVRKLRLIIYRD